MWGTVMLLFPFFMLLHQRVPVRVGDLSEEWIECGFESQKYAEEFASVNHVVAQNRETIQEELRGAIGAVRNLCASGIQS